MHTQIYNIYGLILKSHVGVDKFDEEYLRNHVHTFYPSQKKNE